MPNWEKLAQCFRPVAAYSGSSTNRNCCGLLAQKTNRVKKSTGRVPDKSRDEHSKCPQQTLTLLHGIIIKVYLILELSAEMYTWSNNAGTTKSSSWIRLISVSKGTDQ